jgi:hypothetical protein
VLLVKKFNHVISEKDIKNINSSVSILRLMRSLGYDLTPVSMVEDMQRAGVVSIYKTESCNRFQCMFVRMRDIDEPNLHRVYKHAVQEKSWNLVIAADSDCRYIFCAAVSATSLPDDTVFGTVYPSVRVRRIDLHQPKIQDCGFLEELTRTCSGDQELYMKILHAFNQTVNIAANLPLNSTPSCFDYNENTLSEIRHVLRCELQPGRRHALAGSWHDRAEHLIEPLLKSLGYHASRGRIKSADRTNEPDLFLYTRDPETPGSTPVAACIFADPQDNPFYSLDSSDNINRFLFPDWHAHRMLDNPVIRKVFITDGRLWRVYTSSPECIDIKEFDIFRVLQLDYARITVELNVFRVFYEWFSPQTDTMSVSHESKHAYRYDLMQNTLDALKANHNGDSESERTVRKILMLIFYIFYCEEHNLLPPTDCYRCSIPSLTALATPGRDIPLEKIADGFLAHIRAFIHLDATRYQSAFTFSFDCTSKNRGNHTPVSMPDNGIMTFVSSLKSADICTLLTMAFDTWCSLFLPPIRQSAYPAEQFCNSIQNLFYPNLDTTIPTADEQTLVRTLTRLGQSIIQMLDLSESDIPGQHHHVTSLLESIFRVHVIDTRPQAGQRLIQVLKLIESFWIDFSDSVTDFPLIRYLQQLRGVLIQDADKQGILVDHTCLTYSGLIRYLIVKHCLYGLNDCNTPAPAILFMQTGLSGVRYPYIGHHFRGESDYTCRRLLNGFDAHRPESISDITSSMAGVVSASRWLSESELTETLTKNDFAFSQRQYEQLDQLIRDCLDSVSCNIKCPVELVFPWIFFARISGETSSDKSGNGFDCVLG